MQPVAAFIAWPIAAAAGAAAVAILALVTGWRRMRWLLQGAPPIGASPD